MWNEQDLVTIKKVYEYMFLIKGFYYLDSRDSFFCNQKIRLNSVILGYITKFIGKARSGNGLVEGQKESKMSLWDVYLLINNSNVLKWSVLFTKHTYYLINLPSKKVLWVTSSMQWEHLKKKLSASPYTIYILLISALLTKLKSVLNVLKIYINLVNWTKLMTNEIWKDNFIKIGPITVTSFEITTYKILSDIYLSYSGSL